MRLQRGAAAAGRRCSGTGMRRDTDAAGHGCGLLPLQWGGPSAPHNSVSLYAHNSRERNGENEGSLILPLFVLSSSPLHTSPRPPPRPHPSPFPVPSSFPVSLSLSPPSSPFLTLPFPLSRYPCDLPQAFCFSLKGEVEQDDSIGSGRARGVEVWELLSGLSVSVYLNWHYGNAGRCIKSKKVHRDWGPVH